MKKVVNQMWFLCTALIFIVSSLSAQIHTDNYDLPLDLTRKVNSIESFIRRFNYQEDLEGNTIKSEGNILKLRTPYILALMNFEKFRKEEERAQVMDFVESVNSIDNQVKLNFYDPNWFAEVTMDVVYKKKPEEITIILVNEITGPSTSHWAIQAVKIPFLALQSSKDSTIIIPPNSHGNDFIGLPRIFASKDLMSNYAANSFQYNELSAFIYAVKSGDIQFKMTKKVSYHFLQVKNWIVKVEEFDREGSNSGYLISELIKADNSFKSQYALKQLNVH